jgi:hypothetical protein
MGYRHIPLRAQLKPSKQRIVSNALESNIQYNKTDNAQTVFNQERRLVKCEKDA